MDEVAEPAERALALDRPLQPLPERPHRAAARRRPPCPASRPASQRGRTGASGRAPPPRRWRRPPRPSSGRWRCRRTPARCAGRGSHRSTAPGSPSSSVLSMSRSTGTTRPASGSRRRRASRSSASTRSPAPPRQVSRLMTDTATGSASWRCCSSAIGMPGPHLLQRVVDVTPRHRGEEAGRICWPRWLRAARTGPAPAPDPRAGHACSSIGCGRLGLRGARLSPSSSAHRRPYWSGMVPQPQYGRRHGGADAQHLQGVDLLRPRPRTGASSRRRGRT